MKAVQISQFGGPEVLTVTELATPAPGPGEVLIDVSHAAVGLVDVFFRQGLFKDAPGMPAPPFVPGLEVAGTVRALGAGVTEFRVGEPVVSMSSAGIGGYASAYVAKASMMVSIDGLGIDPALAVAVLPNAAMAQVAFSRVAHLSPGETVLVQGALGGFAAAFPGMAKQLGASRVVGTVRASKLAAAEKTKLPYDRIVNSATFVDDLGDEKFDVIIDAVGGSVRQDSFAVMKPGSRLIVSGNASGDWSHQVKTSDLWLNSVTVSGFNAGAFMGPRPEWIRPALQAALIMVEAGLGETEVDVLTFDQAVQAHERMEDRSLNGRIVLKPE
ncbi:quinone oxidoreductase family protein [Saccharospirillum mangrovi]|uniref:quinone oxidoreductase family protein n=1 Tax=Saccharospirillum mangrovi TaxID=2161747 RepID=UPI000D3A4A3B|nr:zinc-binding dehydrogenase [Saccharospirillum mangrovi]